MRSIARYPVLVPPLFLLACVDYGLVSGPCDLLPPVEEGCDLVLECMGENPGTVAEPWAFEVEWRHSVVDGSGVVVMPAVGNMTDDDGDGVVDDRDVPDIAFTTFMTDTLVLLSGDGSGTLFDVAGYSGTTGVAMGDVDGDGRTDIVSVTTRDTVAALDGAGVVLWESPTLSLGDYAQPTFADLEGDGTVEIIVDGRVLDGVTGTLEFSLSDEYHGAVPAPVIADLDGDGYKEILACDNVFSSAGAFLWTAGYAGSGVTVFPVVVNVDSDPWGEVAFVAQSEIILFDQDGTRMDSFQYPGRSPGPPCAADFHSAEGIEIAVPAQDELSLMSVDGEILWTAPISDETGIAGCSGFDFDADGLLEILQADEESFRLFDGDDGEVLFEYDEHGSGTAIEFPVVADVDRDGSAEVVLVSNSGDVTTHLTVFGQVDDQWPRSGASWGRHDFHPISSEAEDGEADEVVLPWNVHNVFRARPSVDHPGIPDLEPFVSDLCAPSCELGPLQIAYGLHNHGYADVAEGSLVRLFARVHGQDVLMETATIGSVPSGRSVPGGVFDLGSNDWSEGISISVDVVLDGSGEAIECNPENNVIYLDDLLCEDGPSS